VVESPERIFFVGRGEGKLKEVSEKVGGKSGTLRNGESEPSHPSQPEAAIGPLYCRVKMCILAIDKA
jgi:hypothetical protein